MIVSSTTVLWQNNVIWTWSAEFFFLSFFFVFSFRISHLFFRSKNFLDCHWLIVPSKKDALVACSFDTRNFFFASSQFSKFLAPFFSHPFLMHFLPQFISSYAHSHAHTSTLPFFVIFFLPFFFLQTSTGTAALAAHHAVDQDAAGGCGGADAGVDHAGRLGRRRRTVEHAGRRASGAPGNGHHQPVVRLPRVRAGAHRAARRAVCRGGRTADASGRAVGRVRRGDEKSRRRKKWEKKRVAWWFGLIVCCRCWSSWRCWR